MNDYNGGTLAIVDYLAERIKRDTRSKAIQQGAYLIVKGLIKHDGDDQLFDNLDRLFDIPKVETPPQKTQEELADEFTQYVNGA